MIGAGPSPYDKILLYRARAERCRLDAENARSTTEEDAWLELAEDWDILADAFEAENPNWRH